MKSKRILQSWADVAQILALVVATAALAVQLVDFKVSTLPFNSWFNWLAAHNTLVVWLAVALLVVLLGKRLAFILTKSLKLLQTIMAFSWRILTSEQLSSFARSLMVGLSSLKRALRRLIILNRTVVLGSFVSLMIILWALPLYIMYGVLVWAGVVGSILTLLATAVWLNTLKLKKSSNYYKDNPRRYREESEEEIERRREWEDRNPPGPDGDW
jgi:hypothetical protein